MLKRLAALLPLLLCVAALLGVALAGATIGRGTLIAAIAIVAVLAAVLALLLAAYGEREVRRGLCALIEAAQRLADGQIDAPLPAVRDPALQPMSAALDALAQRLGRALQELEAERERFAAVLGRSADGVIAIDGNGIVRYANTAARRLLGIAATASFEPPAEQSFVAVVRDHELAALLERCRAEQVQVTGIVRLGAQGHEVEAIVLPLAGAGGWRYLGLLHDLTEIRRSEGQRRDLVSNLSHELRTPLASIKAVVQVLVEGGFHADDETARELLGGVDHEVDRLTQLVDEMLELSRIESGQVPFQFEPVDAGQIGADAVRRLAAQAERAGVALRWRAEPDLPPLRADPERLLRAVINLVHNAIKFTPAGGSVTVEARRHGGMGEIAVRDTGAGIPQAEQERIFERFYKVDRARSSTGTGLGLAIVKHTAQLHGGEVEVESSPGAGATFRLRIPFAGDRCGQATDRTPGSS